MRRPTPTGPCEASSWRNATCLLSPRPPFGCRSPQRRGHNVMMTTAPTEPTGRAESREVLAQLLAPVNGADPYPLYGRLRDRGPLKFPKANVAVFSTYRDCDE